MANEKTLDFNQAEQKSATANGPAENNTSVSNDDNEDIDQEIDATINKGDDDIKVDINDDDDDDTVVLPKEDLKKILDARDNYKKGLLSVKEKLKAKKSALKSQSSQAVIPPAANAAGSSSATDDDIKGILKGIQDDAIAKFCEDPRKEKNWAKLLPYYNPKRGKTSVRGIVADLEDAWVLFVKDNPDEAQLQETVNEDEKGMADLSRSNGISGSGKGQGQPPEKKSILPKRIPVQQWFG